MNVLLDHPRSWIIWLAAVPTMLGGAWAVQAAPPIEPELVPTTIPAVVYVAVPEASPPEPGTEVVADPPPGSATAPSPDATQLASLAQRCNETDVYVAASGDSWWRIAERADLDPYRLLELNRATPETLILIGDPICLPPGTVITSPPMTEPTSVSGSTPSAEEVATTPPAPESTSGSTTSLAPAVRITPQIQLTKDKPPLGVDGDCESWRPMFEFYGLKHRTFLGDPNVKHDGIAWRESGCRGVIWVYNTDTKDYSFGPLMANRLGASMSRWFDAGGYTVAVMKTAEGAIAASAALFEQCGLGPWDKANGYPCYGSYTPVPATNWGEWTDQR